MTPTAQKVIEIKACYECPYCRSGGINKNDLCLEEARRIPADVDIPDWCPLDDAVTLEE